MKKTTLHGWLSIPPMDLRQILKLPLGKGQEMIKEAMDSKGKKPLELVLRSIYDKDDLIDQRFYYLQNFAKSNEEKILCLQNNIADLYSMEENEEIQNNEVEQKYLSFLSYLHFCHLGEIFWTIPEMQYLAENYWKVYQQENHLIDMVDFRAILLYRYPLLNHPQEFDMDQLLSTPEDTALQTYAKALYYFTQNGASDRAKSVLNRSLKRNPHVPFILLQKKRIPKKSPTEFEPGQQSEAEYIAFLAGESWWTVEGAIHWLKKSMSST
jgi:hypothetical protein